MSDNLRRYRAIQGAVTQGYPGEPPGQVVRHVTTLAALLSDMVASKSAQLPTIAPHVPDGTKPESRVTRCARWVRNDTLTEEAYFFPYADVLLAHVALQPLVLVMDGRVGGRGCSALMLHVVDTGRALPVAWRVRQAPKGHGPEDLHLALVAVVSGLIPAGAHVVVLGDGECAGTRLQQTVQDAGWSSVCRTGTHMTASWDGKTLRLDTVGACSKPGTLVAFSEVFVTRAAYGPILLLCGWAKG